MPRTITGIPASPGIAMGPIFAKKGRGETLAATRPAETPERELARWRAAATEARRELSEIRDATKRELGAEKAEIFDAHLSILGDPELSALVTMGIVESGLSAGRAVEAAAESFIGILASMGDDLFSARIDDIRDLVRRISSHLEGGAGDPWEGLASPSLVLAPDLSPSETRSLNVNLVRGFATSSGSATSHSSILARSMGVPAVVGVGDALVGLEPGTFAILDGTNGTLILNPDGSQVEDCRSRIERERERRVLELEFVDKPSRSRDGTEFELAANVGGIPDFARAVERGADGIGLFRTEFLFMGRSTVPSEEEQYRAYRRALETVYPKAVLIRTLDVGGDKGVDCLDLPKEDNPFLGVRALRLCLGMPSVFRTQLRALLRASAHGRLRVMFPMVAIADELRQAKAIMEEERARLVREGVEVAERIETGIMVEIPSAALMADELAREVDFFSVGSNDLCQYTMAADRMNPRLGYLHDYFHPALLRLLGMVADAAGRAGIWAGVCGEMAADPVALPLLVGAGFRELSMSPASIPGLRASLAALGVGDARDAFATSRALGSSREVRECLSRAFPRAESKQKENL